MPPSLVALTGPLQGQTFELLGDEIAVGRHPASGLRIPDSAISRQHCLLRRTAAGWQVVDLGSRRGTFVNGQPVGERALEHGDFLLLCESTFLVSLRPARMEEPSPAEEPEEPAFLGETEIRLSVADSLYLRPESLGAALGLSDPSAERTARSLSALLALGAAAGSLTGSEALGRHLLERALAAVPAERAALLPADGEAFPALYRRVTAGSDGERPFAVSATVTARVLGECTALLLDTAREDPSRSVEAAGIRSLACVPLLSLDRPLGLLYLDTREPGVHFDADHLQWLAAAAALAAGPLAAALRAERLEGENRRLQAAELGHGLVGESPAMRRVYELVTRVAPTAATVLLLGESGTGKELAARAIHLASPRAGRPFVAINCASLSETLLESELFGHEKGAFTGAVERKTGKLEVAHGGTLFLDEVGEMPLPLQARLLRVLQERTFERVGGTRSQAVDIRLIAATNRDLPRGIAEGTFRADLYYRLNVVSIAMPPLRERREDIPLLASHFASLHGLAVRGKVVGISPEARALLARYDWPGNVRELGNAVERAVVLGLDDTIHPEDLPETLLETASASSIDAAEGPAATRYHDAVNDLKRRLIVDAVRESGGTITRAAERLGLHPNHLHRVITSLGLRDEIEGLG